ncbi:hypothetical protein O181_046560 [Austropuccinia psidii MF-1]|uniref:Uncharacterized protein n=1 Tax=Austropuccinia psidii MF-1 TaxID=1389203 RepID=A0A9Q3HMB2_9BASI|nr:hypothetical protein [Austropuccinia psidii MF-1]
MRQLSLPVGKPEVVVDGHSIYEIDSKHGQIVFRSIWERKGHGRSRMAGRIHGLLALCPSISSQIPTEEVPVRTASGLLSESTWPMALLLGNFQSFARRARHLSDSQSVGVEDIPEIISRQERWDQQPREADGPSVMPDLQDQSHQSFFAIEFVGFWIIIPT